MHLVRPESHKPWLHIAEVVAEIPLVIGEANSALPMLDSTRLLARAALRRAVA